MDRPARRDLVRAGWLRYHGSELRKHREVLMDTERDQDRQPEERKLDMRDLDDEKQDAKGGMNIGGMFNVSNIISN
jgi:hypothetical protein